MEMERRYFIPRVVLLKRWSGVFMVVEVCYLSVGDVLLWRWSGAIKTMEWRFYGNEVVLLWRWSGALWGARGVLCRGKEQCFAGDDNPVVQSFICGEKSGAYLLGG